MKTMKETFVSQLIDRLLDEAEAVALNYDLPGCGLGRRSWYVTSSDRIDSANERRDYSYSR